MISGQPAAETAPGALPFTRRTYEVHLAVFDGPLDLLLHLIRSRRLEISEVSLAEVTGQYLQIIEMMEPSDLDVAGEFMLVAATLMEIKSRGLLPRLEPEEEALEDELDPRRQLLERLQEYAAYQQLAEELSHRAAAFSHSFPRAGAEEWAGSIPLRELRAEDLLEALRRMVRRREPEPEAPPRLLSVRRHTISLPGRISEIMQILRHTPGQVSFRHLLNSSPRAATRDELVVTFLALLELLGSGQVRAYQHQICGELLVELNEKRVD